MNWNSKSAIKFEKKQYAKQKSAKNKPKKQANFNQNKPKNKQPASLKKNCKSTKKQAQIRGKTQGTQHCASLKGCVAQSCCRHASYCDVTALTVLIRALVFVGLLLNSGIEYVWNISRFVKWIPFWKETRMMVKRFLVEVSSCPHHFD